MKRHDAGEREEDARAERRAIAEEPARIQEDEPDRGRPEQRSGRRWPRGDEPAEMIAARKYV